MRIIFSESYIQIKSLLKKIKLDHLNTFKCYNFCKMQGYHFPSQKKKQGGYLCLRKFPLGFLSLFQVFESTIFLSVLIEK